MEINVDISEVEESNEFLRCLWAEMKNEFGKCGWHYTPYNDKISKKIFFGFMDIDEDKPLEVGVTYKRKGSINNIFFKAEYGEKEIKKGTNLYRRLKNVVNIAKQNVGKQIIFYFKTAIQSFFPVQSYKTDNFTIYPMVDNMFEFSFGVRAYDVNQARGFFFQKTTHLMNFLAIETNAVFNKSDRFEDKLIQNSEDEIFQEKDFIDDYSLKDEFLVISEEGKKIIDILTNTEQSLPTNFELFLKACSHFHSARKQEEKMFRMYPEGSFRNILGGDETELATTLYLSALEVTTLIGFNEIKCVECGQQKFQISKRVKELTSKYLPNRLSKSFIGYYDKRSKFLHAGIRLTTETPTNNLIPLLDTEEENGCDFPHKVPLINIREYTSYCLRRYYKDNLLNY